MCFYYSINNKKPENIVKAGLVSMDKLAKLPKKLVVNGFERPMMPVISNQNTNDIDFYQWGFVPSSVNSKSGAEEFIKRYNTLNAKSETASESKAFGNSIDSQRCLILASGFFEWQHAKKQKIPYYITLTNESLFAFAGIWDSWIDEDRQKHFTYSILTTQANELMSRIHNTKKRMPIILSFDQLNVWLSAQINKNNVNLFLKDLPSPDLKAHTIKPLNTNQTKEIGDEILQPYKYGTLLKLRDDEGQQLSIGF
jgi:putative SOS response-associated peptidase YedK